MKNVFTVVLSVLISFVGVSQIVNNYQVPPEAIRKIAEAKPTPDVIFTEGGKWLVQLEKSSFVPLQKLAQTELKLAGVRFNPLNVSLSRQERYIGIVLISAENGEEKLVEGLPQNPQLANFVWSPDATKLAFTNTTESKSELWTLDVEKHKAKRLCEQGVNEIICNEPVKWLNNETILFSAIAENSENKPSIKSVSLGPEVQESDGKKAPVRTFQDLLASKEDEAQFEYYSTSVLTKVSLSGELSEVGISAGFTDFQPSPNGNFILVQMLRKPYSRLVPFYRFGSKVEIWDSEGVLYRELFSMAAAENIPLGADAVTTNPREFGWRADVDATLFFVQALDDGNPKKTAAIRDRMFLMEYPFEGDPVPGPGFEFRFREVYWENSNLALFKAGWEDSRLERVLSVNPSEDISNPSLVLEYNTEDAYNHPGTPMKIQNSQGRDILCFDEKKSEIYFKGRGASPEGARPFIRTLNLKNGSFSELWRSDNPYYEYPLGFINLEKKDVITRRESRNEIPNFFSRNLKKGVVKQLSNFEDPYPELQQVRKEMLTYYRADSVQLTGKLYMPPGYSKGDGLLPVIMWAYPNEYKSADAASQITDSPNRFTRIGWYSPVFWVFRGYAVFDNPSMPIIGENGQEPNDTYLEQLVANAEAAIKCLDSIGIADKSRIAIGGHSYGAFMTANLLAHSNLFAAGIARSGAYNRTLTPFGFQSEERSYWEAKDVYNEMSPFNFANQINTPLLLIHGAADNNPGTYPMQSERMFAAIKGNGGIARLVMLPYESHSYKSQESIMHMLWEMDRWLEKYVKNRR